MEAKTLDTNFTDFPGQKAPRTRRRKERKGHKGYEKKEIWTLINADVKDKKKK